MPIDLTLGKYISTNSTQPKSNYKISCSLGALDFTMLSCSVSENSEAPTFPIDSNTYIGDNVIKGNVSLSCSVFVDFDNFDSFNSLLDNGNLTNDGFSVATLAKTYENLRLINKSYSEDNSASNGIYATLDFIEVKLVQAKKGYLDYRVVTKPTYSSKVNRGTVESKKSSSILYKAIF